jgi:hypothetical protein
MTDWVDFLPFVTDTVSGSVVMGVVGVIELVAGIGVWLRPKIFALIVAAWLGLIFLTLIMAGGFLGHRPARRRLAPRRPRCGGSPAPTVLDCWRTSLLGNPHSPVAQGPHDQSPRSEQTPVRQGTRIVDGSETKSDCNHRKARMWPSREPT